MSSIFISHRLWNGFLQIGIVPQIHRTWNRAESRYPGLRAFDEREEAVFFGRQGESQEVRELLHRIRRQRVSSLLAIHGPSGSGKSSLLHAALLPQLRKSDEWTVLGDYRPGRRAVLELAGGIRRLLSQGRDTPQGDVDYLVNDIATTDPGPRIVPLDPSRRMKDKGRSDLAIPLRA